MLSAAENRALRPIQPIESPEELREALERLRWLEWADRDCPRGRERAELEIEICRYLASREYRIR